MSDERRASAPAEQIAALQDVLYDLIVTRIAQARPHELRRLRRTRRPHWQRNSPISSCASTKIRI
jgi:hypothetical protein